MNDLLSAVIFITTSVAVPFKSLSSRNLLANAKAEYVPVALKLPNAVFFCLVFCAYSNASFNKIVFWSLFTLLAFNCLIKPSKTVLNNVASFSVRNKAVNASKEDVFDQLAKALIASARNGLS